MPFVSRSFLSYSLGCTCFVGGLQNQFLQTGMGKPERQYFFLVCCSDLHWISSIRTFIHNVYWAMHVKKEYWTRSRLTSTDTNNVYCRSGSVHLLYPCHVASMGISDPHIYVDCFLWSHFQYDVPTLRKPWKFALLGRHRSYWLRFAHFAPRRNLVIF